MEPNLLGECRHDRDEERALTGTWVLDEIRLAVEKGYRILEIFEIYEFDVWQYNRETGEGGLFAAYIDMFLKLKDEASGYPSWVQTPDDEDRFIEDFWHSEGIRLNKDAIKRNPAKRGVAKLCLNSMWGKLTEKSNRTKTELISEPKWLYKFLSIPGIEVVSLLFASDQVVWVSWRYSTSYQPDSGGIRHRGREAATVPLLGQAPRQGSVL
jgi:hypothetical protein